MKIVSSSPASWLWLMVLAVHPSCLPGVAAMAVTVPYPYTHTHTRHSNHPSLVARQTPLAVSGPIPFLLSPTALSPTSSSTSSISSSGSSSINQSFSPSGQASSSSPSSTSSQTPSSATTSASASSSTPPPTSQATFHLNPTTLIPAIIALSLFLLVLGLWLVHGWCTRRPKFWDQGGDLDDNWDAALDHGEGARGARRAGRKRSAWKTEELICGPEYAGVDLEEGYSRSGNVGGTHMNPDVDSGGLGYGRPAYNPYGPYDPYAQQREEEYRQTRWPSMNHPPAFDNWTGFHTAAEGNSARDEDPSLVRAGLVAASSPPLSRPPMPPLGTQASVTNPAENPSSSRNGETLAEQVASPPVSIAATSLAFREMYSAESFLASGAFSPFSLEPSSGAKGAMILDAMEKEAGERKARRVDSSPEIDEPGMGQTLRLEVRNPSVGSGRLSSGVPGQHADEDEDAGPLPTPMPTPMPTRMPSKPTRAKSRARSRTGSKSQPNPDAEIRAGRARLVRDVLPAHPTQIMSPPLESQMFFIGGGVVGGTVGDAKKGNSKASKAAGEGSGVGAGVGGVVIPRLKEGVVKTRGAATSSPVKSPASGYKAKSDKTKSRTLKEKDDQKRLPFPRSDDPDDINGKGKMPEVYRGRLMKNPKAKIVGGPTAGGEPADKDFDSNEDVMRRLEEIVIHGWEERDLNGEKMRCLSPSGFGKG